jgi:hypothetical protein
MSHDPELPGGFQDADFDQRGLEAAGALTAALRRRGICDHGWLTLALTAPTEAKMCLHRHRGGHTLHACTRGASESGGAGGGARMIALAVFLSLALLVIVFDL